MASATVDPVAVVADCSEATLHFEDVPQIDLRLLTQSELYSLSVSVSPPSPSSQDDSVVSIPKIDRSVFNESAGSRKQTYFRLRLAPRNSSPNLTPVSRQETPVPEPEENSRIISLLKDLFAPHGSDLPDDGLEPIPENDKGNLIPIDVQYDDCVPASSSSVLQALPIDVVNKPEIKTVEIPLFKKKRGRPRKNEISPRVLPSVCEVKPIVCVRENVTVKVQVKEEKQLVGALKAVDIKYFEEELRKMTEGLRTEDEFSKFMSGLTGEWGSRRKKRKIVDSSSFGDVLPAGWKLMLSINNDGGRVWVGCSHYMSPDGRQYKSSKDVPSHVLFPVGKDSIQSESVQANDTNQLASKRTSGNNHHDVGSTSALLSSSVMVNHQNHDPLLISGSSHKFQMQTFKCHKCTLSFDEKDNLLLHLLSSHKRSKKIAGRGGLSNPEATILRDGKYECQLCHKLFEEKSRFTSHFGNHIREYVKRVECSAETSSVRKRMSKQEAIPVDRFSTAKIDGDRNWEFLNTTVNFVTDSNNYDISNTDQAVSPRKELVTMVRYDERVCNDLGKQQMIPGLTSGAVKATVETSKIASGLRESAEVKSRADQTAVAMDNKESMNSVSSVDNLTHETERKHDVAAMSEKSHAINNENLVSSLFDSSMEEIDLDELDDGVEVGNGLLIPEIGDPCFALDGNVVNDRKQQTSHEGSFVQIGDKERITNDNVTGTRASTLRESKKETESGSYLPPSPSQKIAIPDSEAVVAGTVKEHMSYNSWLCGKTIDFHQETATSRKNDKNSVQESDRSFPGVQPLEKHSCIHEETKNRRSIPEVQNLWQQKVLEGTSVSTQRKTSVEVESVGEHFVPNAQTMWQQKVLESNSLSASFMKDSSKEPDNALTRPVLPSLNHHVQDVEEHQKGHSTSKIGNRWQQKVADSSSVSAPLKTSDHDAQLMNSSGTMEPTKVNHDTRQHSSVSGYGRNERSSGVGLPFSPQHQQCFPIINASPSVGVMEVPKDFRSGRGQSHGYQDYDKIGNVTSFRNRDKQKREDATSTWNNANSFAFDNRYSLHDDNAAMVYVQDKSAAANAHLFVRNTQTVAHDNHENVVSARNTQTVGPDHSGTVVSARNTQTVAPRYRGNAISPRNTQTVAPNHRGNVTSARNTRTVVPPDHRGNVISARSTQAVAPDHRGHVVSPRNTQTDIPDQRGHAVSSINMQTVAPDHRGNVGFGGTVEEARRNKEPMFGLFSAGADQQTSGINYNMNMYYSGTMPSDRRGGNVGLTENSEQTMGFYNQSKPRAEVITQPTWRTEENTLQNGLHYASQPMAHQSDCFPTYNTVSDNKVQSGYYGSSNQKIGNRQSAGGGGGVRSGVGEYLEYNFLPVQSTTTSHSVGSKIAPPLNQQQIQQQQNYDSNWLQKDALGLFPKGSSTSNNSSSSNRHQVTAFCVWCGNHFNIDAVFDEVSVGYMCYNCKAKFPGEINFF